MRQDPLRTHDLTATRDLQTSRDTDRQHIVATRLRRARLAALLARSLLDRGRTDRVDDLLDIVQEEVLFIRRLMAPGATSQE